MKLSEIKGERTIEVIADIIEPVAEIAGDPVAAELFTKKALPEGMTPAAFALQRIKKAVPALLKGHKASIIAIMATLEGVSAEEYAAKLDLVRLVRDLTELLSDDAFSALFTSAQSER